MKIVQKFNSIVRTTNKDTGFRQEEDDNNVEDDTIEG